MTPEVCWICKAGKGNQPQTDVGLRYTNLAETAAWRSTYWTEVPFNVEPEFLRLPGFSLEMLQPDILHVCHLGTSRDLVGSAMRVLTSKAGYFQGATQALRLRDATTRLQQFCSANGYTLSIGRLTTKTLQFTKGFPELRAKGYDSFVVLRWLVSEITVQKPQGEDLLATCLWSLDSFLSVATNAGKYFSETEVRHLQTVGMVFLRTYAHLAVQALQRRRRLFRVRPKYHLLMHMVLDIPRSRCNFTRHATWLDEDFNKHVIAVKSGAHKRTATEGTLKRWLLGLPAYFRAACAAGRV